MVKTFTLHKTQTPSGDPSVVLVVERQFLTYQRGSGSQRHTHRYTRPEGEMVVGKSLHHRRQREREFKSCTGNVGEGGNGKSGKSTPGTKVDHDI